MVVLTLFISGLELFQNLLVALGVFVIAVALIGIGLKLLRSPKEETGASKGSRSGKQKRRVPR